MPTNTGLCAPSSPIPTQGANISDELMLDAQIANTILGTQLDQASSANIDFTFPSSIANFSAAPKLAHRLSLNLNGKRPTTPERTFRTKLFTGAQDRTTKSVLLEARDLIIEASSIAVTHQEQSRILDLLELFREYTEKGQVKTVASILASQVNNLETATRKIESKTKALTKTTTYAQASQPTQNRTSSIGRNLSQNLQPQEWTLVGQKTKTSPTNPIEAKPSLKLKNKDKRAILIGTSLTKDASVLSLRNMLNKAFEAKGIKGPVVASITKSLNQNTVITTTGTYSANFLLEKQDIQKHIIPFKLAQLDESQYKVVVHRIPIADFNNPLGMDLIKEEISTFNKGLTPIGTPYWLTPSDKRVSQRAGSVAVAFATQEEANKAIYNRLYIAGISTRVEKHYSTAPTTQCNKCQGFGHLDSYCRKHEKCRLCGESHATSQHYCKTCKTKGTSCLHLAPKCINCKESHQANSKLYEVFLAIKAKHSNTSPSL